MAQRPRNLGKERLSSSWLNQLVAYVAGNAITVDGSSGLAGTRGAEGWSLGLEATPDLWIKLTGMGPMAGSYAWVEQIPDTGGGWRNGPRASTMSDPAWEANLNSGLPAGYFCLASRDGAVGRLSFHARACS